MAKFGVYIDRAGEYRWRFRANNGRIMADSGEGYTSRMACLGGIQVLKDGAGTYQDYQDRQGEYRWRFLANNYRIVADSGEGYSSKRACLDAIETVKREVPNAGIEDE